MRNVALQGDSVIGSVGHHAGHLIGYDNEGNPIYCSGHTVIGHPQASSSKLRVRDTPVIVEDDQGGSNCACDGGPVVMKRVSHLLRVGGKDVILDQDDGDFHKSGSGQIQAKTEKLRVKR